MKQTREELEQLCELSELTGRELVCSEKWELFVLNDANSYL